MKRTIRFSTTLITTLLIWSCSDGSDNRAPQQPRSVYTALPISSSNESKKCYTSSVEEGKSINSGFKTGGEIKRLTANEGDYVRKGQVIGYLDDADYRLSVRQLESQYNQMSSEMKRLDEMFKRNNIAPNDYEKARSGLEQVKTQLDMTRNKLAYTRLESPASGYVVERYLEEGEMAGAGTPVYRIIDNSSLETSVALPSSIYSRRDEIVSCTGRVPQLGDTEMPLEIIGFVPDADNNSLFRLRLRIPTNMNGKLLPGTNMSVQLHFKGDGSDGCHIPSRAIFERNGKEYVWVVNMTDSTLSAHEVGTVGAPEGKLSRVTGLTGSERIVAVGVHHLTDGEKVKISGDINTLEK